MTLEEVVKKFKTNPKYLRNGAGKLSKRWKCSVKDINEARLILKLENIKKQSTEIKQTSEDIKVKRLFFDIETSPNIGFFWKSGYGLNIGPENIISERAVICVCYKWEDEDKVHYVTWDEDQNDKLVIKELAKILEEADEVIAHNGDSFDIKWLRTRALYHRISFPYRIRTLDTLKKARNAFSFNSNKLDYIGKFLGVGEKVDNGGFGLWKDIILNKSDEALDKMVEYCMGDVILLQDIYSEIHSYIHKNTSFSVLNGRPKWRCVECISDKVKLRKSSATVMGVIKRHMICKDCGCQYDISNKTYQDFLSRNLKNKE